MQLLKFQLTADVKPRVNDVFCFTAGHVRLSAQTHVPQMFVDNVARRQPREDTSDEQDSRYDDPEVVDLTQTKEKVGNRVNRRHDIEREEHRKSEFKPWNAFVSEESPAQPELITYAAIEQCPATGKHGSRSSSHR